MGGGPVPEIEIKALAEQAPAKNTEAEAIQVFTGKEELPRGFFFYQDHQQGQERSKLFALPEYPSADSAHVVIAAMATKTPAYITHQEALLRDYKLQASEMGANALYMSTGNLNLAFAIYASSTPPSLQHAEASELMREERKALSGYKPLGVVRPLPLTQAALQIDTRKARCYAMSVALAGDAQLSHDAQAALYVSVESDDGLLGNGSVAGPKESIDNADGLQIEAPTHGRFVAMRSFSSELGCARGPARANIMLWSKGKSSQIGSGSASVQIYERSISNAELAHMEAERAQQLEQARIAAEEQRQLDQERERERQRQLERDREDADRLARQDAARASSASSSSASAHFSISLKNECSQTVKLFIGETPKFGSGTSTSVSSNSINSYSGSGSQTYWIVDDSGNGISSYSARPGSQSLRILPSCTGFAQR